MTLRHLLHLQKLWWGTGLLTCTSESLSWRWEFEIEAINLGLSCLTALHPPRVQGSVREQAGSYRCLSARSSPSTPSGSGGRYTWAVSREPLSAFKYPHQTTWTSDQILNGLQIMQRRRLFYWGGGGVFGWIVSQGTEAWLRSSDCSMRSECRKKWPRNYITGPDIHCSPSCMETWGC